MGILREIKLYLFLRNIWLLIKILHKLRMKHYNLKKKNPNRYKVPTYRFTQELDTLKYPEIHLEIFQLEQNIFS